jgi:hypothetical protein
VDRPLSEHPLVAQLISVATGSAYLGPPEPLLHKGMAWSVCRSPGLFRAYLFERKREAQDLLRLSCIEFDPVSWEIFNFDIKGWVNFNQVNDPSEWQERMIKAACNGDRADFDRSRTGLDIALRTPILNSSSFLHPARPKQGRLPVDESFFTYLAHRRGVSPDILVKALTPRGVKRDYDDAVRLIEQRVKKVNEVRQRILAKILPQTDQQRQDVLAYFEVVCRQNVASLREKTWLPVIDILARKDDFSDNAIDEAMHELEAENTTVPSTRRKRSK